MLVILGLYYHALASRSRWRMTISQAWRVGLILLKQNQITLGSFRETLFESAFRSLDIMGRTMGAIPGCLLGSRYLHCMHCMFLEYFYYDLVQEFDYWKGAGCLEVFAHRWAVCRNFMGTFPGSLYYNSSALNFHLVCLLLFDLFALLSVAAEQDRITAAGGYVRFNRVNGRYSVTLPRKHFSWIWSWLQSAYSADKLLSWVQLRLPKRTPCTITTL